MQKRLTEILREFESLKGFLNSPTDSQKELVNRLFFEFMDCFNSLKEEKLDYPKEFLNDVRLYTEEFEPIINKFRDDDMKYLMLSDFYDFCRIKRMFR